MNTADTAGSIILISNKTTAAHCFLILSSAQSLIFEQIKRARDESGGGSGGWICSIVRAGCDRYWKQMGISMRWQFLRDFEGGEEDSGRIKEI